MKHEERSDNDLEEDGVYQDDAKEIRKISREAVDAAVPTGFHLSNAEKSFDRDNVNLQRSNEGLEEVEEADEEAMRQGRDKNEEASNLMRLPRNINADFNRYTDQDERSSLYDDYEAKDIAKRGVLSGSEDYEEIEDDSPGIEDMAAVQESTNEAEKRETQKDARVKRNQAKISEMLDKSELNSYDSAKFGESKIAAKNPYSHEISRIELSKSFNAGPAPNDASKIKDFGSKDVISKLSDFSKIQEPTSIVALSKKDNLNAEYEKRVEEEIQRKIDSIKEEIQRDIEAQQRRRDIERNNAKFDELQNQENENEDRQNFEDESINKRQSEAKRSVQKIIDDVAASSKSNEKKRSLTKEQYKKRQHRSSKIDKSNTLKENENLKKRVVAEQDKSEQIPLKDLFKKKRERVRQIFLVNNNQPQTKKREMRSSTLPSDRTAVRSENELFMNPDLNSYLHTDNRMVRLRKWTKIIYYCAMFY